MHFFLVPLLMGFAFNWASAFTHYFSKVLGDRSGRRVGFVLRNVLGIPVWVGGLVLASGQSSSFLFAPGPATAVPGWMLIVFGAIPMVWGIWALGLRLFCPTDRDTLISDGIYRCIRHPIYSGLLLDFLAPPLLRPTRSVGRAAGLGWGYVFVQARLEEIDLAERMPGYRSYMKQVPRFFPRFGKIGKADFSSGQDDEGSH